MKLGQFEKENTRLPNVRFFENIKLEKYKDLENIAMVLRKDDESKISFKYNAKLKRKQENWRLGSIVMRWEVCETTESTEEWRSELQKTKKSIHDYDEVPGRETVGD